MTMTGISSFSNRLFIYEVTGLQQNDQTDGNTYPIRTSSSVFIKVPYERINYEFQRIGRLGGKVVGVTALGEQPVPATHDSH